MYSSVVLSIFTVLCNQFPELMYRATQMRICPSSQILATTFCFLFPWIWLLIHVCVLSCIRLFATPWIIACQAPLSMDFPGTGTHHLLGIHYPVWPYFPLSSLAGCSLPHPFSASSGLLPTINPFPLPPTLTDTVTGFSENASKPTFPFWEAGNNEWI